MADEELPHDPFEPDVPDFEDFTGPHADEIRELIRRYAGARTDFSALVQQPSFRELGVAIGALDEQQARDALLYAMVMCVGHYMRSDRERFEAWIESQ